MTVFERFLRDRRKSTVWWTLGVAATIAINVVFYPSIKDQQSYDDLAAQMPEAVRKLLGVNEFGMASPQGFLWSQLFSAMLPILLLVFGIAIGARAIGGSEEDGTLELLLANPVTRRRVLLERFGTMVLLLVGLVVSMFVVTMAMAVPLDATEGIPFAWLLASFVAVLAIGLLHATIAFGVGAVTGKRGKAIAVASAVAIAAYVVEGLGSVTKVLRPLQLISPFHWLLRRNMLGYGIAWDALWLPVAISAVVLVVGLLAFERRDLG